MAPARPAGYGRASVPGIDRHGPSAAGRMVSPVLGVDILSNEAHSNECDGDSEGNLHAFHDQNRHSALVCAANALVFCVTHNIYFMFP